MKKKAMKQTIKELLFELDSATRLYSAQGAVIEEMEEKNSTLLSNANKLKERIKREREWGNQQYDAKIEAQDERDMLQGKCVHMPEYINELQRENVKLKGKLLAVRDAIDYSDNASRAMEEEDEQDKAYSITTDDINLHNYLHKCITNYLRNR